MTIVAIGLLLILGAGIGALSAFIGLGGGIVLVPLLPYVVPMAPSEAAATSLFTILLVAVVNSWKFTNLNLIPWWNAGLLGGSAGAVSFITASFIVKASELAVQVIFGLTLLGLIAFLLFERRNRAMPDQDRRRGGGAWLAVGGFCGLMSGSTGIGGGLIAGPLLLRLRMAPGEMVVPLVNVMMIFSAGFGVAGYALNRQHWHDWRLGAVWLDAAVALFAGAQLTSPFGIKHQARIPNSIRRKILMALLFGLAGLVWWEILFRDI